MHSAPRGASAGMPPVPRAARVTWVFGATLAAVGLAIAVAWCVFAVTFPGPIVYGEGPIIAAAQLALSGSPYVHGPDQIFVAANYTPLYYEIVALGPLFGVSDPFLVGRVVNLACWIAVAALIARIARPAGLLVAFAIASTWLVFVPAVAAASTVRPDMLEVAFTAGGVVALLAPRPSAWRVAALFALAVLAKQTAVVPVAFIVVAAVLHDRALGLRLAALLAAAAAAVIGAAALTGALGPTFTHIVAWNALDWTVEDLAPTLVMAALGLSVAAALSLRSGSWPVQAYVAGGIAVVLLGGREGAYVNYLLHLAAASAIGLAMSAEALGRLRWPVPAIAAQLLAVAGLMALGSARDVPTLGANLGGSRPLELVSEAGVDRALVEDSGLVVAVGARPIVDDLFLWSRLADAGVIPRSGVLDRLHDQAFSFVVSDFPLEDHASAPRKWRERWPDWLAQAVLAGYERDRDAPDGPWIYRKRR